MLFFLHNRFKPHRTNLFPYLFYGVFFGVYESICAVLILSVISNSFDLRHIAPSYNNSIISSYLLHMSFIYNLSPENLHKKLNLKALNSH